MRRWIFLGGIWASCFLLASCGRQSETSESTSHSARSKPPASGLGKEKHGQPHISAHRDHSGRRRILGTSLSPEAAARMQGYRQRSIQPQSRPSDLDPEPVEDLLRRYDPATDPAASLDVIYGLSGRSDARSLEFLRQAALGAPTPALRVAALEALAEAPNESHLPVASAALSSSDPDVQAAGVWLLSHISSKDAIPLWNQAILGGASDTAQLAFDRLSSAPESIQVAVARGALNSHEPWIVEHSLLTLGGVTSKEAVEALIPAIDHPDSGDLAQDGLRFLVGEFFATSADAQRWWQENKASLRADLQPLDLDR